MKLFTLFLCLISMSTVAGLPPTTLVGNDSGESNLFFKLKVPNAQSTKLADGAIIETGNENILANPSFESSRSTTGYAWSVSGATASLDTTNQIHGKNALSLALSSTLNLNQSAATNVANTVGLQAVASVYIKSSLADVNVCSIINNVEDKCVQYNGTNTWVKIEIPFIFGATQNGIKVKTTSSTSGTVLVDNAFVGLSSPFQNVNGAKLMGTLKYSATAGCQWSTSSTSFSSLALNASCPTPTTTGSATAPSTKIPGITFASLSAGTYYITTQSDFSLGTASTSALEYARITDGTNFGSSTIIAGSFIGGAVNAYHSSVIVANFQYSSTQSNITFQPQLLTTNASNAAYIGAVSNDFEMQVYYFPPESKIYSQASQDYDWTAYTPTFTGFGTVTNATFWHKREGSDLLIRGNFQAGTVTATTPSLTLPNSLSIDTTKIPSVVSLCSISQRGISATSGSQYINYTAINPTTPTVLKFATGNNGLTGTNEITNATISFGNGEWQSISTCRIPIQGWQDYGVIVGSFQYVPQVPGQSNVDVFSVSYGTTNATTICTASPCSYLDQIGNVVSSITRSAVGTYALNLTKTYTKLKCTSSHYGNTTFYTSSNSMQCSNCNVLNFTVGFQNATADSFGTIYCQGSY